MCLAIAVSEDPADTLGAFREAVYTSAFGAWHDAPFDLLDALLTAGAVPLLMHLSLAAMHRREHGSLYGALARGAVLAVAVERLRAGPPCDASEQFPTPRRAPPASATAQSRSIRPST